jgi:glycosyltransferase involved in cell wall biosynthesis
MIENKPYFSVVMPLYNKQSHVKEAIETVLIQTFQDFEIIVVNDGSKDDGVKIIEDMQDSRIRIIHQKNQGVSAARNNGIKEAEAKYIAFLDADDVWLPKFLETIHKMTINFQDAGIYATQYELVDNSGQHTQLNIKALPSNDYIGVIPNYFKSITLGDNLVWTSAVCIPKKIFVENDIWFPVGEKYGEDQHVWARVAMLFDIVYNTNICALYNTETENNTTGSILKEKNPHDSILSLRKFRKVVKNEEKLNYLDKYIQKHVANFIFLNMKNDNKRHAIKQIFEHELSAKNKFFLFFLFFCPIRIYPFLKKIRSILR